MSRTQKYSRLQIALHWLIVVLIVAAWLLHDQMEDYDKLPLDAPLPLHGILGLSVFFLMILRLVVRLWQGAPPPPEGDPAWQRSLATISHWGLYALGILGPWAGGFAFYLRADWAAEAHELLIGALVTLALIHTAAALYHQVFVKDGLIRRMMP